jgi:hypothetical protein
MHTHRRDSGSIVLGWLTKVMLVMTIAGIVLFDGVSVGVARMSAQDDANTAAGAAGADWKTNHNVQSAYNAAASVITNPSERVLTHGFVIGTDGTVHLLLRRSATTLVMYRIGPLKKYGVIIEQGEAAPPTL